MSNFGGGVGQEAGIEIWRTETTGGKPKPVPWPVAQYGKFYVGDSYIVLNTKVKPDNTREQDVFTWQGAESSQDEYGASAFFMVELDDHLGGFPVQHREVMGGESKKFMSLFKKGFSTMEGGIDSGFTKVDRDAYEPKFLHLKGKRNVRVSQVKLTCESMNEGDVFVLDAGLKLYQWNGSDCNKFEKNKAFELVRRIKDDERGGRAEIIFIDQCSAEEANDFWTHLGGKGHIKSADEGGDDGAIKKIKPRLYQVSDASGSMEVTEVEGELVRDSLKTEDVFIVDAGDSIHVWCGKGSTKAEKANGMSSGVAFLEQSGRPNQTPVSRCMESGEPAQFKSFFKIWDKPVVLTAAAKKEKKADDLGQLYKRKEREAEESMAPAAGKLDIWRVQDFKQVPVDPEHYGQFHAGDSFLILFTYKTPQDKEAWIIYFWQGRDSSQDERAAVAKFAVDLDDSLGGAPVQVRVVQNKEPSHFLSLFQGHMVVHEGGVASGFKNANDTDSMDTDGISLFHVKGTSAMNTRGVQVAEVASSLNSSDAFVLLTPGTMYVWYGKGCLDDERESAQKIAGLLSGGRQIEELEEGSEPDAFWDGIGGKGEYPEGALGGAEAKEPRLFQCCNTYGNFSVDEIFDFAQDDLVFDDIMLLDTYESVYVWIGPESNIEERHKATEAAMQYVVGCDDGRDADTPVFRVAAGCEPITFTCHFLGWDASKAVQEYDDPYMAALVAAQKEAAASGGGMVRATAADTGYMNPEGANVPLADLQAGGRNDIDPMNKEQYLSEADFEAGAGMSKSAYNGLAQWKKNNVKKKLGLF